MPQQAVANGMGHRLFARPQLASQSANGSSRVTSIFSSNALITHRSKNLATEITEPLRDLCALCVLYSCLKTNLNAEGAEVAEAASHRSALAPLKHSASPGINI